MNTRNNFIIIILISFLAACQTTATGTATSGGSASNFRVAKESYSLFYDQKDHLTELVAAGNFNDASILYEEQRAFFDAKSPEDAELAQALNKVVEELSRSQEPEIAKSREDMAARPWPASVADWDSARTRYRHSLKILSIVPKDGVFVNPAYQPVGLAELKAETDAYKAKLAASFNADFQAYDHFGDKPFFGQHPAMTGPQEYFDAHPDALGKILTGRSAPEVEKFATAYKDRLGSTQHWKAIGKAYVEANIRAMPKKDRSLASILAVIKDSAKLGFEVKELSEVNIGFVEVTSRTLLKERQIEFPAEIDLDLPFSVSKADLDTSLDPATFDTNDYLIVVDVALAKTRRKVGRMRAQRSERVVGYKQEANPEYKMLQNQITTAQMAVQNEAMNVSMASAQYCYGLACLGKIVAVAAADAKRNEAQTQLQALMTEMTSTDPMIDVAIMEPYSFQLADVDTSKTMTVHYYVIDKAKKRYFKSTFDITENERFGVAYQVDGSDPKRTEHISSNDTEEQVADWERQPSTIKLSQLIDHFLANQEEAKPLRSLTALREEMLQDRNTALASHKANTFEESTANDPRFDSVVVIYMPSGGLGSGFFVTPDVVMTNYHVVGEGQFVELKMHDNQETFGKVIARDAMLDLALIRVQTRGKPVRFYDKNKIELGSTVEVIGHPRRFEFSITRGVVSAVRKGKSVNLGGGADVLLVQIDAAANPGNSGGPVFMKDYVISVISFGRTDAESLNFTIHHSEAQRFLRENLGNNS